MTATNQWIEKLPQQDQADLEDVIARFEVAWQQCQAPTIEDYLPEHPVKRQALLLELVHADLDYRLRVGESIRVESYLDRYPDLAADATAVISLIVAEYKLRGRQESGLTPEEYVSRFPQYREQLAEQLRALSSGPERTVLISGPPPVALSDPGQPVLPGYQILGELGRGGMGVVYRALQLGTKRQVALKMIRSGSHALPEELKQFRAEAEAVALFQHPHIVQIYEIGDHQGLPFLALEYVEGGNLAERLAGTPQPARQAATMVETLARAMHYAHQRGVVHRDLKPLNVLLAGPDTPANGPPQLKITDFGLAKRLDETSATHSGILKGTPCYMAPEQARSHSRAIGPGVDIYALGVILYEMLTGRPPFNGTNILETLEQVWSREPVPPRRFQPGVPRDLETICLKCLAKDVQKRYATAEALADDLRRFSNGEPIRARPTPLGERLWKWARRERVAAALLSVSVLGVFALLAAIAFYAQNVTKELDRVQYLDRKRQQFSRELSQAQKHEDAGRWPEAHTELKKVQAALDALPDLRADELRDEVRQRLAGVEYQLEETAKGQAVRLRRQRFQVPCDEALFHEILFTGLDVVVNRAKTRAAARTALAFYGLDADPAAAAGEVTALLERDRRYLDDDDHLRLAGDCYMLLLIWAETEVVPLPGQAGGEEQRRRAENALALLDRAARLGEVYGLDSQTYYFRKAQYVALRDGKPFDPTRLDPAAPKKPTGALDWFLKGLERYRTGHYEEAAAACREVLRQQRQHFSARYVLALCQLRQGRWVDARAELTICLNQRPEFAWPRLLRGFAASELGFTHTKPELAAAEFQAAEEDFDSALAQDRDPLAQYVGLANRGVLNIRRQRWQEAIRDLRKAVKEYPQGFQGYANLAQALQGEARWEEAVKALDQAIELAPHVPELYGSRARLHLLCKHRAAARADFEQAIEHEPQDSKSDRLVKNLVELGRLMHKEQKYIPALASYDRALRLRLDFVLAQRFRAETLLALHCDDEAGKALDAYLAVNRNAPAEVYQARGLIDAEAGRLPAAIDRYSAALQQHPEDTSTRRYRGWAYLLSDSVRLALADFEACLEKEPTNADALAGRGTARIRLKQRDEALADAAEAEKQGRLKNQLTYRLLYNLACLYSRAMAQLDAEARTARPPWDQLAARQASRLEEKALQCLSRALEELSAERRAAFWHKEVEANPALAAIRRGKLYLQLSEQYGKSPSTR